MELGKIMLEKEVLNSVCKRLACLQLTGEVVYYLRVNSGTIKTSIGTWVKMADSGHPDIIAIIRNKQKGLDLLFIEAKKPGINLKLRPDQLAFKNKYKDVDNVHFLVVDHPDYVTIYIDNIAIDRVKDITL